MSIEMMEYLQIVLSVEKCVQGTLPSPDRGLVEEKGGRARFSVLAPPLERRGKQISDGGKGSVLGQEPGVNFIFHAHTCNLQSVKHGCQGVLSK